MDKDTLLYSKRIRARASYTAQGTLLNVMWQPGWGRVWGETDTCIWMAGSLCCPPETITISGTLKQNKRLRNTTMSYLRVTYVKKSKKVIMQEESDHEGSY